MDPPSGLVDRTSSSEAKIACSGRSPVAAKMCTRVDSRVGRRVTLAIAPACVNEWVRGICEKPRIKCAVERHDLDLEALAVGVDVNDGRFGAPWSADYKNFVVFCHVNDIRGMYVKCARQRASSTTEAWHNMQSVVVIEKQQ